MFHFTYLQSIVVGLLQGVTELFPISSLGHAVLVPAWLGGSWKSFAADPQYLLVAVAFHFASAIALFIVFGRRWLNILGSALRGLRKDPSAGSGLPLLLRLIVGTIPVAILGLSLNKLFEKNFGKPLYAAVFLTVNGLILFGVERLTDRRHAHAMAKDSDTAIVERVSLGQALVVGVGQSTALFAGISRFGVSISFGMMRGLSRSVAADFAFLLAFPAILGASVFKLPKLRHAGAIAPGSNGALLAGTIAAFIATFISVKFLVRYFKSNTLRPFALYCLIVGFVSILRFGVFGS
jgi:undecaprenyl-diphosphatase